MERTLSAERLYSLAEYQNIKFSNVLTGIPEEIAANQKIVELLFLQQAISCDVAYAEYKQMRETIAKEKVGDVLGYLREKREQTYKELAKEIMAEVQKEKDPPNPSGWMENPE